MDWSAFDLRSSTSASPVLWTRSLGLLDDHRHLLRASHSTPASTAADYDTGSIDLPPRPYVDRLAYLLNLHAEDDNTHQSSEISSPGYRRRPEDRTGAYFTCFISPASGNTKLGL